MNSKLFESVEDTEETMQRQSNRQLLAQLEKEGY